MRTQQIVFVIDPSRVDINCGHLTGQPSAAERMVKFKHRGRSIAVPAMLCFDTLDAAKDALIKYLAGRVESVEALEFDEENFWVV